MKRGKRSTLISAGIGFLLVVALGFSQTSQELARTFQDKDSRFEVASVKAVTQDRANLLPVRNRPLVIDEAMRMRGGPGTEDPSRITYTFVTMRMLVRRAYGVKFDQIAGPNWLDEQRYDVVASVPAGTDKERIQVMLQYLLTERFQIQVHREKKTKPVYDLIVAKTGSKLRPAEAGQPKNPIDPQGEAMARFAAHKPGTSRFASDHGSIGDLIDSLSLAVDRPVIDRTQLRGQFRFELTYYPELPGGRAGDDAPRGPSVFDAVKEQLGLELVPAKGEIETLILDRVNRFPSDN